MKHSIIENNFLYRPWEALRISARLDREGDGVLLERAVQQGAKRHTSCRILSFVESCKRRALNVFEAIYSAFSKPVLCEG